MNVYEFHIIYKLRRKLDDRDGFSLSIKFESIFSLFFIVLVVHPSEFLWKNISGNKRATERRRQRRRDEKLKKLSSVRDSNEKISLSSSDFKLQIRTRLTCQHCTEIKFKTSEFAFKISQTISPLFSISPHPRFTLWLCKLYWASSKKKTCVAVTVKRRCEWEVESSL